MIVGGIYVCAVSSNGSHVAFAGGSVAGVDLGSGELDREAGFASDIF